MRRVSHALSVLSSSSAQPLKKKLTAKFDDIKYGLFVMFYSPSDGATIPVSSVQFNPSALQVLTELFVSAERTNYTKSVKVASVNNKWHILVKFIINAGFDPSLQQLLGEKLFRWRCMQFTCIWASKPVHFHDEVIPEEEKAHDGEQVDQDDGQNSSEENRAAVTCHTLDDVKESLLTVDQIKQLKEVKEDDEVDD